MTRWLPLLLLLPGLAAAQELRSGPNAPAASSQIPPSEPSRANPPGRQGGAGDPSTQSTDHIRGVQPSTGGAIGNVPVPGADRGPPPHPVLGGPPVPGATQPRSSEGFTSDGRSQIPPNIGERVRPNGTTTGR